MEVKKRNLDEEIDIRNICIGMKVDNFSSRIGLNIGLKTFDIFEKTDYQIGIIGQESFTIYKDMEEEKYSYVGPDGKVFIPKGSVQYAPSNHLSSITDVKSFREIINELIIKYNSIPNLSEQAKKGIASYQRIEDSICEAEKLGKRPMIKLGDFQSQFERYINLYIAAFGNPLDKGHEDKDLVRAMTDKEIEEKDKKEKAVQAARSQFRIVDNDNNDFSGEHHL